MILFKKILKWTGIVLVGLFVILVIIRAFYFYNLDKTNAQVAKIHATKLTLDDVMGKNLPPDPGAEADKTVRGIDVNQNGIRDDVELAVFKTTRNSIRLRAAQLQLAQALQIFLVNDSIDSDIYRAIRLLEDYGASCVRSVFAILELQADKEGNNKKWDELRAQEDESIDLVRNLMLNVQIRKYKYNERLTIKANALRDNFQGPACNFDMDLFPN